MDFLISPADDDSPDNNNEDNNILEAEYWLEKEQLGVYDDEN